MPLRDQPVSPVLTSRRKIPLNHRHSPPDRHLESQSQDATPFAMQPTTALPSARAGDPARVLERLPVVLKMTGLALRRSTAGSPTARSHRRCARARVRWPGVGRTWTAGPARAPLRSTDCAALRAGSRAGAARRQRTLDAARGAPTIEACGQAAVAAPCPASPSGGEDIPFVGLTLSSITARSRGLVAPAVRPCAPCPGVHAVGTIDRAGP